MKRLTIPMKVVNKAVEWRHFSHSIPELAYAEWQTSAFVAKKIADFGLSVETGSADTGIVTSLTKENSDRTIGLRADMDARQILETANLVYRSTRPGKMHACCHDGHMAILLAAPSLAEQIDFDGTVRFIFQPVEENEGGVRRMIKDGLFERLPVDAVYGLHKWPQLPAGKFVADLGPIMAAFSTFNIVIRGNGTHGGMLHEGIDPIVACCAVVSVAQSVVGRNVLPLDAGVHSVTQFHASDA